MHKNIAVILTDNDNENIERLIEEILSYCKDTGVPIVDDNCPDGTSVVA